MIFRTLIFSKQAQQIAEMLPGAEAHGWICFDHRGDIQATKTAAGLIDPKAFIVGPFWCGFTVAVLLVSTIVSTALFGFIISHQNGLSQTSKTTEVR